MSVEISSNDQSNKLRWYYVHREDVNKRRNAKVLCVDCNRMYTISGKCRHFSSRIHTMNVELNRLKNAQVVHAE